MTYTVVFNDDTNFHPPMSVETEFSHTEDGGGIVYSVTVAEDDAGALERYMDDDDYIDSYSVEEKGEAD